MVRRMTPFLKSDILLGRHGAAAAAAAAGIAREGILAVRMAWSLRPVRGELDCAASSPPLCLESELYFSGRETTDGLTHRPLPRRSL